MSRKSLLTRIQTITHSPSSQNIDQVEKRTQNYLPSKQVMDSGSSTMSMMIHIISYLCIPVFSLSPYFSHHFFYFTYSFLSFYRPVYFSPSLFLPLFSFYLCFLSFSSSSQPTFLSQWMVSFLIFRFWAQSDFLHHVTVFQQPSINKTMNEIFQELFNFLESRNTFFSRGYSMTPKESILSLPQVCKTLVLLSQCLGPLGVAVPACYTFL